MIFCALVKKSTCALRHHARTVAHVIICRTSLCVTVLPATREKHVSEVGTISGNPYLYHLKADQPSFAPGHFFFHVLRTV